MMLKYVYVQQLYLVSVKYYVRISIAGYTEYTSVYSIKLI